MPHQGLQILVICIWLESQLVLKRHGERDNQVQAANLRQEIVLPRFPLGSVSLLCMYPNQAREVLRGERQLGPIFAALVIAFVGGRRAEAERQGDDETEYREEELIDANCKTFFSFMGRL